MYDNNDKAQEALALLKEWKSFFLTGKAGTGKTTLTKHIIWLLDNNRTGYILCAPTGLAAVNVWGMTIHKAFGIGVHSDPFSYPDRMHPKQMSYLRNTQVVIIDEISMTRADLLDTISSYLCYAKWTDEPFGWTQMIFVGDPYQLPPVTGDDWKTITKKYPYQSEYFFDSVAFKKLQAPTIELDIVHRQSDPVFINFLNRLRYGESTLEDISYINDRSEGVPKGESPLIVTPMNRTSDRYNEIALARLPQDNPITFKAEYNWPMFDDKPMSTILHFAPAALHIKILKGTKILCTVNDPEWQYINGTIAYVDSYDEESIQATTEDGRKINIKQYTWKIQKKFLLNQSTLDVKTLWVFKQFPIRYGRAISIHKSQGMTFDSIFVDPSTGMFASWQLYVALSRCRTYEGLYLKQGIKETDIITDPVITQYLAGQYKQHDTIGQLF